VLFFSSPSRVGRGSTYRTAPIQGHARARQLKVGLGVCLLLGFAAGAQATSKDYFGSYGLVAGSAQLDLGTQPLAVPVGVVGSVMRRDRILQNALASTNTPLAVHPFERGGDMVALWNDQRLEAGLGGDMPSMLSASVGKVWIVGLIKQASTAIVAKGNTQVRDLAGKRVGYIESSNAHLTLLQGLASAGLTEKQIQLVPLRVDQMADALDKGSIDAFAAWEPAPAMALAKGDKYRIVFRGVSTAYFVIGRPFAKQSPEAARHLIAALMRAVDWMQRSARNVERAVQWSAQDAEAFVQQPSTLSIAQMVNITRRELLDVPSVPAIPVNPSSPPLKKEFSFLEKLGKLPPGATWANVAESMTFDGVSQVLAAPTKYQLGIFNYGTE
jgi:ABC-type nitrate/sulfonate/bicarbonate transport system substrate-binding protein